ncbi:MAG: cysteine hydrolase family protein [Anaerolineales bacterium]|jgi:nicotinamidase-related amidase
MSQFTVLESSKTVMLVIDVQRALFTRPHPVYQDSKVLEVINNLVERAHLYGLPVVYIQHSNDSILKEGSDGWKLHPALKPTGEDYSVHKKIGNAFKEPALMSVIEARDIKNVIVTGLVSQGCIRATSLGGVELGLRVFLVKGGHSNYNNDAAHVIEKVETELESAGVNLAEPGELAIK